VAQEYTQGLYTIFQNYITSDNGIVEQFKLDFSGMINKIDNIAAKSIKVCFQLFRSLQWQKIGRMVFQKLGNI